MKKIYLAAASMLCGVHAYGYEPETHHELAKQAAQRSILQKPDSVQRLGLVGTQSSGLTFWNSRGEPAVIQELIAFGAKWEDDRSPLQALRHFFNPRTGSGLTAVVAGTPMQGTPSPEWAVSGGSEDQPYSLSRAKRYFHGALTLPTELQRSINWGMTFQSLGHVIHHVQDMAQPQHVRNDAHCPYKVCWLGNQVSAQPVYSPNGYEQWVLEVPLTQFDGYAAVNGPGDLPGFDLPQHFWSTAQGSGRGIAEYTNRGFLSARTMKAVSPDYPDPDAAALNNSGTAKLEDLCAAEIDLDPAKQCPPGTSGFIRFYGNTIIDTLRASQTLLNERAAASSLYDPELKKRGLKPIFALNRFTMRKARDILIPRAVGYSVGLINHFFRGKLEIGLPDAGVYGVLDHSEVQIADIERTTNFKGFDKIKFSLSAPATDHNGNSQTLSGGQLLAVLKFKRNRCWQDDLSGYPPTLVGGDHFTCRTESEEVILSNPLGGGAVISLTATPQQFTATLAKQLPLNATDVRLQVIYKGRIGQEDDVVAVETKDLAEPTFFTYFNASDYYIIDIGGGQFKVFTRADINDPQKGLIGRFQPQSCVDYSLPVPQLKPDCGQPFPVKFGATVGNTTIDVEALPPQRFIRIAMLGDAKSVTPLMRKSTNSCLTNGPYNVSGLEWQLNFVNGGYLLNYSTLTSTRGVPTWSRASCAGSGANVTPGADDHRYEPGVMADLPAENRKPYPVLINLGEGF